MRGNYINLDQQIVNKINAKQNFTFDLSNSKKRYVVSIKNIYKGKNPSLWHESILTINSIIKKDSLLKDFYDSFGGWSDKTNTYYVDLNIHFNDLQTALNVAKQNKQKAIYDIKTKKVINL